MGKGEPCSDATRRREREYLEIHDGRKALDFVDGDQVLERLRVERGELVLLAVHGRLFLFIADRLELVQETVVCVDNEEAIVSWLELLRIVIGGSYWLPNSAATKRKPVLRMHMAFEVGTESKYLILMALTLSSSQPSVAL
jgi:hypothetical protein